ncbi:esterase/lipase family protein [Mucilaginibacter sp.]|uniref:esterase/lipase family protein n=1 Tax=Mucilaginibacter sp. TaxID=1882438 RepID=UPI003B00AB57
MKLFTKTFMLIGIVYLLVDLSYAQNLRVSNYTQNGIQYTDSLYFTQDEYSNFVFGNLNFQSISSGYLLDKSLNAFVSEIYDGKNSNDSTVHNISGWFSLYTRLQGSNVNGNANLPDPDSISTRTGFYIRQGQIPLVLINKSYQRIKNDALLTGLFTTNADSTQLYDNPSRTTSPYTTSRLFVNSTYWLNKTYTSTGEVRFVLPNELFIRDTTGGPLEADFGDGKGYRTIQVSSPVSVQYSSSGIKTIKIKIEDMVSISEFNFTKSEIYNSGTQENISLGNNNSTNGLVHTNGVPPAPEAYYTQYLGCDQVLNKPILIVEGLVVDEDPSASEIFDRLNRNNGNSFLNNLQRLGYDILVVKFTQNHASIYDNAAALERLIVRVNNTKTGTEKLHIVALSMGGLVTKYCLKSMESRNVAHNVQNYISYDSPHEGANVPLGLQILLDRAGRATRDIRKDPLYQRVFDALNSVAAKQLLLFHYSDVSNSHASFAANYAAIGFPVNCNNYAVADGRGDAIGLGYGGGSQMLDINAKKFGFNQQQRFWATNTTNSQIMYFHNGGLAPFLGIKGLSNLTSRASFATPYVLEPVPGSTSDAHISYGNGVLAGLKASGVNTTINYFGINAYSFVPTVSALNLNNQSYGLNGSYLPHNAGFNVSTGNVVVNQITPFQDVIFSNSNLEHLAITPAIANFITTKIYGSVPNFNCNDLCSSTPTFTPTTAFCQNADQIVTMNNFPPGVGISWSAQAGVVIVSGQGTNQIHIISKPKAKEQIKYILYH